MDREGPHHAPRTPATLRYLLVLVCALRVPASGAEENAQAAAEKSGEAPASAPPAPTGDTPGQAADTPAPPGAKPAAAEDTPAPTEAPPASDSDTPAPAEAPPAPTGDTPGLTGSPVSTPAAGGDAMNAPRSPLELTLPSPLNPLEEALGFPIDGTFSTRYRLRWTKGGENEHDQDLHQDLYLSVGDPSRNRVSGVFHGRLTEDIDGRPREGFHVYEDITDTYDHRVNGRFYLGYLELRRLGWMDRAGLDFIRGGRQTFEESAETFIFDGGRIDTRPFRSLRDLRFTAYGGLPVHYFESSPSGDVVAGAGVEARPIPDGRVRIDSTYIEDRRDEVHARDHLLSFALWQSLGERFSLHGRYNLLDGDSRDYTVRGTYQEAPLDLLVQASFHQVVKTLRQLSTELDPYFSVVQELRPYWQASGRASKGFGKHVVVDAGMDVRELQHEEDEADFNHEFLRYYVTPATRDWPAKGMSLAVTVEMWDSSDDEIFTAGAEVSQRILQVLLASAGTYYSLYKYDLFAREERTRVRTYFGRLEYRLARDLRLHGVYEYERDDEFDYHTVELGVRYNF